MKKNKKHLKLILSVETLRNLEDKELQDAAGANPSQSGCCTIRYWTQCACD